MNAELERERLALVQADRDIAGGQGRVNRQLALIAEMRTKGLDSGDGERLLTLLDDTLVQWERHREMIIDRIAYLEDREQR